MNYGKIQCEYCSASINLYRIYGGDLVSYCLNCRDTITFTEKMVKIRHYFNIDDYNVVLDFKNKQTIITHRSNRNTLYKDYDEVERLKLDYLVNLHPNSQIESIKLILTFG